MYLSLCKNIFKRTLLVIMNILSPSIALVLLMYRLSNIYIYIYFVVGDFVIE